MQRKNRKYAIFLLFMQDIKTIAFCECPKGISCENAVDKNGDLRYDEIGK